VRHLFFFSCLKNETVYFRRRIEWLWAIYIMAISRNIFWIAFFASILTAWWWLYSMSLSMNMDLLGRMSMDNSMSQMSNDPDIASKNNMSSDSNINSEQAMSENIKMVAMPAMTGSMLMNTSMKSFVPLAGMWSVMMAAMMLPTMVPTLRSYEDLMVSADGTRIGWLGVLLGYLMVWIGCAIFITVLQMGLLSLNIVDMMGRAKSLWVSAALLMLAGAFQFTRAKEVCHGVCHSPMSYFLGHWKTGLNGGVRMGVSLGAYCVGCCWLFMVLGFAGGVMNFLWMGLATLMMVLEKLPQLGHFLVKPLGSILILSGLSVVAFTII
jgi:predicted metal-binding membrane protein